MRILVHALIKNLAWKKSSNTPKMKGIFLIYTARDVWKHEQRWKAFSTYRGICLSLLVFSYVYENRILTSRKIMLTTTVSKTRWWWWWWWKYSDDYKLQFMHGLRCKLLYEDVLMHPCINLYVPCKSWSVFCVI